MVLRGFGMAPAMMPLRVGMALPTGIGTTSKVVAMQALATPTASLAPAPMIAMTVAPPQKTVVQEATLAAPAPFIKAAPDLSATLGKTVLAAPTAPITMQKSDAIVSIAPPPVLQVPVVEKAVLPPPPATTASTAATVTAIEPAPKIVAPVVETPPIRVEPGDPSLRPMPIPDTSSSSSSSSSEAAEATPAAEASAELTAEAGAPVAAGRSRKGLYLTLTAVALLAALGIYVRQKRRLKRRSR